MTHLIFLGRRLKVLLPVFPHPDRQNMGQKARFLLHLPKQYSIPQTVAKALRMPLLPLPVPIRMYLFPIPHPAVRQMVTLLELHNLQEAPDTVPEPEVNPVPEMQAAERNPLMVPVLLPVPLLKAFRLRQLAASVLLPR